MGLGGPYSQFWAKGDLNPPIKALRGFGIVSQRDFPRLTKFGHLFGNQTTERQLFGTTFWVKGPPRERDFHTDQSLVKGSLLGVSQSLGRLLTQLGDEFWIATGFTTKEGFNFQESPLNLELSVPKISLPQGRDPSTTTLRRLGTTTFIPLIESPKLGTRAIGYILRHFPFSNSPFGTLSLGGGLYTLGLRTTP